MSPRRRNKIILLVFTVVLVMIYIFSRVYTSGRSIYLLILIPIFVIIFILAGLIFLFSYKNYYKPLRQIIEIKDPTERIHAAEAYKSSGKKPAFIYYFNTLSIAYFEKGDWAAAIYYNDLLFKQITCKGKAKLNLHLIIYSNQCTFTRYARRYEDMQEALRLLEEFYHQHQNMPSKHRTLCDRTISSTKIQMALLNKDLETAETLLNQLRSFPCLDAEWANIQIKLHEAEIFLLKDEREHAVETLDYIKKHAKFQVSLNEADILYEMYLSS